MSGRPGRKAISQYAVALLGCTVLAGVPLAANAQGTSADSGTPGQAATAPAPAPTSSPAPAATPAPASGGGQGAESDKGQIIKSIAVAGAQRLEPATIVSYVNLRVGERYTAARADQALDDLAKTELFSDYSIENHDGNVVIRVVENPIVNRIILEGNKRLKDDKIRPEIQLKPREIFTRSKVRADVNRIIELYKRQGRFAATVKPEMVKLDQNRVDVIFDIHEGPKSKVRRINIIGNHAFSDSKLRGVMLTKEANLLHIFSSNTSYDPDRMAYDQQLLRQFYLKNGYADFRVISAVAELTPDKKNFIITYVIEEGKRYKFGNVKVVSDIRDFDSKRLTKSLSIHKGEWYDASKVDDTIDGLEATAGQFGYAFAKADADFTPHRKQRTMDVTFTLANSPRVYVESVNIRGNTLTQDKVIRREFRIVEGDAFSSLQVKRTTARINSLGYFQDNFKVKQHQGSAPDRVVLDADVQEKPTGELSLSAGYSSLQSLIFSGSIKQNNFRGRGQSLGLSLSYSNYSKSGSISFQEPYLFDRNISAGISIYRQDYNNGYYSGQTATYQQTTTGITFSLGVPLTEYMSAIGRYTLSTENVSIDPNLYYTTDANGVYGCSPLLAGRYLCDALGHRINSILGLSLVYRNVDNYRRPTRGETATVSLDLAGLGGSTRYARIRFDASKYWSIGSGFVFSLHGEGGYIHGFNNRGPYSDNVLLTDRFFLGEPNFAGFDIRGLGPKIIRQYYYTDANGNTVPRPLNDQNNQFDALGGDAYYFTRAELEIPLGSGARQLGLRPSIFVEAGSVFGLTTPSVLGAQPNGVTIDRRDANGNQLYTQYTYDNSGAVIGSATTTNPVAPDGSANVPLVTTLPPFVEGYYGNSAKPRVSVGIGVNWNSPFGPFRINIAKVILKEPGDQTKLISFNVGTQF